MGEKGNHTSVPDSVMAAVDAEGGEERLVIADTAREGAWVSMDSGGARALGEWA
jgi:hypothetical protein